MRQAVSDDLNTPKMFGILFEHLAEITNDSVVAGEAAALLQEICGLTLQPLKEEKTELSKEAQDLIMQREKARASKDWKRADEIRDELRELGVDIQDKKL